MVPYTAAQDHPRPSTRRWRRWAAVGSAAVVGLSACGSNSTHSNGASAGGKSSSPSNSTSFIDIPVGADFSQTGSFAQYDLPGYQGAELAISQINKTGFVVNGKHYKFKLYATDSQSNIATGVTQARSLITDDHIVALFGPVVSPIAVPVAQITGPAKVIQFTPSSSIGGKLATDPASYPYLTDTEAPVAGANGVMTVMSKAVGEQYGIKTVAQLEPADATGQANGPGVVEGFQEAGAKIVYNVYFPPNTTDFTPYVQKIAALHPDALVVGFTDAEMIPIITAARQLNAAKYYIGLGSENPALKSGSTPLNNYFWFTPVVTQTDPSPAMSKFISEFTAFTGQQPGPSFGYAVNMYPWPFALMKAMQAANSVSNVDSIEAHLRGLTLNFPGQPLDKITISKDGQAYPPFQACNLLAGASSPKCTIYTPSLPAGS